MKDVLKLRRGIIKRIILILAAGLLLLSCGKVGDSNSGSSLKLALLDTIDLSETIEEVPVWFVTEDRIYMACFQEIVVRALDMQGNLIAELDEIGLGPGEIKGIGNMFYHPYTKEIEILDWEQNKFNYFDYDLNFLRGIPKEEKTPQFKHDFGECDISIEQEFENRDGKFLFIIKANINLQDSVKVISTNEIDILNYDFGSEVRGAAGNERVYLGKTTTDKIEIEVYDLEGNKLNTISHSYPKILKTEEELEELQKELE